MPETEATNGVEIIEFDFLTGIERKIDAFPSPAELWSRLRQGQKLGDDKKAEQLLTPRHHQPGMQLRYYQEIAVNRAVEAILKGVPRILRTMATGTGKTPVAFQIFWKLWNALWNRTGEHRRPKVLYLADRKILIDDPKDKAFVPFGDARWKITGGKISKGRECTSPFIRRLQKLRTAPAFTASKGRKELMCNGSRRDSWFRARREWSGV